MQIAWQQFLMAVMFLTRLPVSKCVKYDAEVALGMAAFFPAVGWLIGGLAAVTLWLSGQFLPWIPAVIVATAITILMTGAFHEDGFADMCDAFGGGWGKDQVLLIMKDSRLGTYGTLGLGLMVGCKLSLLSSLMPHTALSTLIAGHVLSRTASTSLLLSLPYVRDTEDPDKIKTPPCIFTPADCWFTVLISLPTLLLLPAASWLPVISVLFLSRMLMARYYMHRIGGYTGDCLGGAQQISELLVLLVVVSIVH